LTTLISAGGIVDTADQPLHEIDALCSNPGIRMKLIEKSGCRKKISWHSALSKRHHDEIFLTIVRMFLDQSSRAGHFRYK
jgi:hypothetical protein